MDKVINVKNILVYKEAVKRLKEHNIQYDTKKLLEDPELCQEIIRLTDYFENVTIKDEE
jgi:hypothetical protein